VKVIFISNRAVYYGRLYFILRKYISVVVLGLDRESKKVIIEHFTIYISYLVSFGPVIVLFYFIGLSYKPVHNSGLEIIKIYFKYL